MSSRNADALKKMQVALIRQKNTTGELGNVLTSSSLKSNSSEVKYRLLKISNTGLHIEILTMGGTNLGFFKRGHRERNRML